MDILVMGFHVFMRIIVAAFYVIEFFVKAVFAIIFLSSLFKLFQKAGVAGWKALIPVYNIYTISEIAFGGTKKWLSYSSAGMLVLSYLTSMLNIEFGSALITIIGASLIIFLSFAFVARYGDLASVGLLFLVLPVVCLPMLAFSSEYQFTPYSERHNRKPDNPYHN